MKKNLYTKTQLAKQIKELVKVRPLKTMTIQYIADACGINRGTFYYHFCDRQELINWIYHNDITVPIQNIINGPIDGWRTIALVSLDKMYNDKTFYLQAAKLYTHNNLIDYMKHELEINWRIMIQRYIDLNHLNISIKKAEFFAD